MMAPVFGLSESDVAALVTGAELPVALLIFSRVVEILQCFYEVGGEDYATVLLFSELLQRARLDSRGRSWTMNGDVQRFAAAHKLRFSSVHSLATVTGLPRETVRRKIETFEKRNWVVRNEKGGVAISLSALSRLFARERVVASTVGALKASEELIAILGRKGRLPVKREA